MCTPKVYKIAIGEACRFMVDCLHAAGANCTAATQQAELLIQADKYGHPSHGMNRLEMYVNDIISGSCQPNNIPIILKQSPSTAWIDAKNVLGATVSHIAMDIAISKAAYTGVGWVTVKGSNHNGIAGFWAKKAACKGMIGIALTNTSPLVAPSRSKEAALGTNPIAVVALGSDCEMFYLDMATSAVALGKIGDVLDKGQVKNTLNQRACMRNVMKMNEARKVCQDRSKWKSVVSDYPSGKQA